jgi:hypothetical protein
MNFDLEDGKPPVSFALGSDDAERFVAFMAECEAGKTDAARYRWLRDFAPCEVEFDHTRLECGLRLYIPAEWAADPSLDDSVDSAMASTPGFHPG